MDFKKLANKAKDKADAEELKKVAKGDGSLADKAKAAAAALKDPGARGEGAEQKHKANPEGEKHPAKHAGHPSDTPRKGGPPHQ